MNSEALRYLVELAMATRKADHLDALSVASRTADSASRMALALGAHGPRECARYFDLISSAIKYRRAELIGARLAPRPWTKEGR
ncbi:MULTISPECIES: hypothetical protein [Pseudomonas]|uniref:Uncharacterized protein n=1 Tax=Pseudomonas nitroreducens TaxID=46680 RepID=A0A6G6IPG7_PSENT|nr:MULTISPECIES: hypothetical protein [Pseudomonas]MDU4250505.1 hypothetical protein [Pseudomonas sp.]QIE84949.1 hypothetical protein G5B91_01155 [Pseudomonas nitroreducens]